MPFPSYRRFLYQPNIFSVFTFARLRITLEKMRREAAAEAEEVSFRLVRRRYLEFARTTRQAI
jgi:hypothetical protein